MKNNKNIVRVMIGSEEHSTFVKVPNGKTVMIGSGDNSMFIKTGIQPKSIDERLDQLIEEWNKEDRKENIKKK